MKVKAKKKFIRKNKLINIDQIFEVERADASHYLSYGMVSVVDEVKPEKTKPAAPKNKK